MTITAVVVDDEPLARKRLRDLLTAHPHLQIAAEAGDGTEAIRLIDALRPDVVFLDIEIPGVNGLDVARRTVHQPQVVFTTAFDRYAVAAFELAAVDYLLKPFGAERLDAAIRRLAGLGHDTDGAPSLAERMEQVARGAPEAGALTRFFVRDRGKLIPVTVNEVERLEADDDYVRVIVRGRAHLVHLTLNDFERRLDPQRFVRIHRSHIVNLEFVRQMRPGDGGRLEVEMHDGQRVLASRTRSRDLRTLTF